MQAQHQNLISVIRLLPTQQEYISIDKIKKLICENSISSLKIKYFSKIFSFFCNCINTPRKKENFENSANFSTDQKIIGKT